VRDQDSSPLEQATLPLLATTGRLGHAARAAMPRLPDRWIPRPWRSALFSDGLGRSGDFLPAADIEDRRGQPRRLWLPADLAGEELPARLVGVNLERKPA
jgi:hypothetical protein